MGVMDRYNIKKKEKEESYEKELSSIGGVQSRYEFNKSIGTSNYEVNDEFINKFFSDAKFYLGSAEEEYSSIGFGNASSIYDARYNTWKDLYSKSNSISKWLENNKDKIKEDTYKSLSSSLSNFQTSSAYQLDLFKMKKEYYSQWDSEESYNSWVTNNDNRIKYDSMTIDELKAEKERRTDINTQSVSNTQNEIAKLQEEKAAIEKENEQYSMGQSFSGSSRYQNNIKRIQKINMQIDELNRQISVSEKESPYVLYRDDQGDAVNIDTLIQIKSAENTLKKIESIPSAKVTYDALVTNKEDIDTIDKALATVNLAFSSADAYTGLDSIADDDDKKRFEYLSEKYGIDFSNELNVVVEELDALRAKKANDKDALNSTFASQGFSWEALDHYNKWIESKENAVKLKQKNEQYGIEHPIAATIFSILAAPTQIIDYAGNIADSVKAAGSDEYSPLRLSNIYDDYNINAIKDTTGAVSNLIGEKVLEKTGSEFLSWLSSTAYSGVTSSVQSAVTNGSCIALFGPEAGAAIALGIQASEAAASQFNQSIRNGSTNGEALTMSVAAGAAEALFEKLPLDRMLKNIDMWDVSSLSAFIESIGKSAKGTVYQGLTEALEETGTSLSNFIADGIINGDHSEYNNSIRNYMDAGYSREEAELKASNEYLVSLLGDAVGGFIGGFSHSGVTSTFNTVRAGVQLSENIQNSGEQVLYNEIGGVEALKALANDVAGVTKGNSKNIKKLADKVTSDASGKNIRNVGKLSTEINYARVKQNEADIKSAMVEKGMTDKQASEATDVLMKGLNKGEFSKDQLKMIEDTPAMKEVLQEVVFSKEGSVAVRNAQHQLGRMGIRVDEKGNVNIDDLSDFATKASDKKSTEGISTELSENQLDVSYDGKNIANGKELDSLQFVDDNGTVMVKVDDDTAVSHTDVAYASEGLMWVVSSFVDMGIDAASVQGIVDMFEGTTKDEAKVFVSNMKIAFENGRMHLDKNGLAKLTGKFGITQKQAEDAYRLGEISVQSQTDKAQEEVDKQVAEAEAKAEKDKDGNIKGKHSKGKIIFEGEISAAKMNESLRKLSLGGLKLLSELSPVRFHIFESTKDADGKYSYVMENGKKMTASGWYVVGTRDIWIDINAGDNYEGTMLWTAAHEISHYIKAWNAREWKVLADFLLEEYEKNNKPVKSMLSTEIAKIHAREKSAKEAAEASGETFEPMTEQEIYDEAFEELVCESMVQMFDDGTIVKSMAEFKQKEPGIWKKIGEAIKKLLADWGLILDEYKGRDPHTREGREVASMQESFQKFQELYMKAFEGANYAASLVGETSPSTGKVKTDTTTIGARNMEDFADAKNTEGKELFQYRAMEADESTYRNMLVKWGKMTDQQVDNLFETIDKAMDIIKDNLEVLDYAWESDIDDRAFSPVKPNSDSLYKVSLDFSTLCRKRILQQTIQAQLQEALNQPLTREEGIAIRDALIALQEEGRQIEVACALCYVESARMKSPAQIQKFLNNRETVLKDFFAGKSGGSMKEKVNQAEARAREKLHKENPNGIKGKDGTTVLDPRTASLKSLPKKYADAIRDAKKSAKSSYKPTAEEQKLIDVAMGMTVSDFTSPEGLERLAKEYPSLFDAYTSYVRNATKSKGIENDTWWRAGDSEKIGDVLIANMNRENGLRSQSWSDFQVVHILDYIASTIELATRNAKEQAYSKVPDYIELMGQTGVMLNMSLIPTQKFDGKLEYDSVEGMAYQRALELREKYPATAGTICIGIDNKQIQMLLADTTIDYVIPYHKSGMAASIRKLMHIPTWSQYEEYQSEKELSDTDAKKNAEKYGVKLLDKSDPNYHKHTSFSEWFDIEVAKQIAKMENSNPSNKAMQKKYGVMYGGYMAMQDAANNYLKLCAERGLSPKFSHEKADFTVEDNYWKLLIDRKMVNNATGEIIEQHTIQPIFDEGEVLRILNDELDRYPSVKADQDYAVRKVTEKFLSREVKSGMSAEAIAKVMKTPVDNITKTNIVASSDRVVKTQARQKIQPEHKDNDYTYIKEQLVAASQDLLAANPVAIISSLDANTSMFSRKQTIKEELRLKGKVIDRKGFGQIMIDTDEVREALSYVHTNEDVSAFRATHSVLKRGVKIGSHNHHKGHNFSTVTFGGKIKIDGKDAIVAAVVKQTGKNRLHAQRVLLATEEMLTSFEAKRKEAEATHGKMTDVAIGESFPLTSASEGMLPHSSKKVKTKTQERSTDSNRYILATALESAVKNPIEQKYLTEYKEAVSKIDALESHLQEVNAEIREIRFTKGKYDKEKLKKLSEDATKTANRISTYDKKLLRLEANEALKKLLGRERAKAYAAAKKSNQEAMREYREKNNEKLNKIVSGYQESRKKAVEKVRETRDKRDAKAKLQKLVLDTSKWLSSPSKNDVKCPDVLKGPYAKFLNSIDLSSKRLLKGGAPTKNDLIVSSAIESLANAIDRVLSAQDPTKDTNEVFDSGYLDLPEKFVNELRDTAEKIKSMMVDGDYVVNQMSSSDIRKLSQMIRTLNHSIKEISTLYSNMRFSKVNELGAENLTFLDSLGKKKSTTVVGNFISWDNALPYYVFKRFGNAGVSIMESLMDAQDKLAFNADEIFKFKEKTWTDKQAIEWSNDTHTIDLPSGGKLTLTTADAMSIYCLSRRDQAKPHLLQGGVRVIGKTKGTKTEQDSSSHLKYDDIRHIISTLSDEQIKVANAIQKFMSTVCADWGNEIFMKRFLTKEFTEKFYFPIESNDQNLNVQDPKAQHSDLYRLLNISATKALTRGANNQIVIRNIFDVFTNHSSDMARLNAYGMALLDYMKWLNYKEKTVNDSGEIDVKSTKKSMDEAYGDKAFQYVLNLIKDINGRYNDGGNIAFLSKMARNTKVASVAGNLRVAVLQFTAYPRAAMVLSVDSLAKGLTKVPKIQMAQKYCGIALWKSFGFYDTNIARSIEEQIKGTKNVRQKLIELSLKGAEWGDAITWGCLWNACEYEVAKTKKYKVGTEEFYQAVGKKLREVVYATQVVDSTLTRSQVMRQKDGVTQMVTAFMSEPTLSANILMDAGFQFSIEKRRTGSAKAAWKLTGKYITKSIAVYSAGQLLAAVVEGLMEAFRDDDDDEFKNKFIEAFAENAISDIIPFNKIPVVSDMADLVLTWFDIGYFSSDNMSLAWLTNLNSAVNAWSKVLSKEETGTTVYNAIYNTTKALSSMSGLPGSNLMREAVALWNNTAGASDITLKVKTYERTSTELGQELYEAIVEGDTKQAESLREEFEDENAITSAIRKAIKENDPRITEAGQALFDGDNTKYEDIVYEIIDEGNFSFNDVVAAVQSVYNDLKPDEESTPADKKLFKMEHFFNAIANGDRDDAEVVKDYIIEADVDDGKTMEEAEKEFNISVKTQCGDKYKEGTITESKAKDILITYGGKTQEEATNAIRYWDFEMDYPDLDVSESAIIKYFDEVESTGISVDVFTEFYTFYNDASADVDANGKAISGSKKAKVMAYINSLPISNYQKDALYRINYKQSTIGDAPWH